MRCNNHLGSPRCVDFSDTFHRSESRARPCGLPAGAILCPRETLFYQAFYLLSLELGLLVSCFYQAEDLAVAMEGDESVISLSLDMHAHVACAHGTALDYRTRSLESALVALDVAQLQLDVEIADCALLPRTFWMASDAKPRCSHAIAASTPRKKSKTVNNSRATPGLRRWRCACCGPTSSTPPPAWRVV